ncbi:MAG: hypothetical protein EXS55_00040 [Candidatus Magasanikbacteria bacterium]|nr:hypothetical protein [Candidatus Magasanikbacteria bacterium]
MDNYSAWNVPQHSPDIFKTLPPREQLEYLCALAHLAPSTHNTQPWRFKISVETHIIELYLDRNTVLPASDVVGRQSVVSCGTALAHLKLASEYYGFKAEVATASIDPASVKPLPVSSLPSPNLSREERRSFPSPRGRGTQGEGSPLAIIALTPATPNLNKEKLITSIWKRKMMRAEFKPDQLIPTEVISELKQWTDNDVTKLHIITDPVRRLSIAEFQAQADGFVINSTKFSRELGDWLLPNDTNSPVGMPGIGFGLQDEEAKRLHAGLSGEKALEAEDGLRFALGGKMGLEKSPLIGFITTKDDTPESWLAAGEAFEKMNLTLVAAGLSVAMHAGITEVPLIKKIFSVSLGTLRPITVLFRAGYLKNEHDANRPHSPRLPLSAVILKDK